MCRWLSRLHLQMREFSYAHELHRSMCYKSWLTEVYSIDSITAILELWSASSVANLAILSQDLESFLGFLASKFVPSS